MPSNTTPALPTADLRKEGKAYRRDKDHSAKWARGGRVAPGKKCPHDLSFTGTTCNECVQRPLNARNNTAHFFQRAERASIHHNTQAHRQGHIAKKVLQNDLHEVTVSSDTGSSDEEVAAASEAPVPETEVMYSFDARSGPSNGADILSTAVVQAVKRFENKQTEQLIKAEYDVLDGKEFEDAYAGDAEDDFEVIDAAEYLH